MIAGRLRWKPRAARRRPARSASPRSTSRPARCCSPRRARRSARRSTSCAARPRSRAFDRGGLEALGGDARRSSPSALARENHTLKRALTDPRLFSGIGNAYSDEILHRARLSPLDAHAAGSTDDEIDAAVRRDARDAASSGPSGCAPRPATASPRRSPRSATRWPCTAAIGEPCPVCGAPVQRIVYADNETNYCAALPDRRHAARRPRALAAAARRTGRGRSRSWSSCGGARVRDGQRIIAVQLQLQLHFTRSTRRTAGGPRKVLARGRLDADPKVFFFGVVDGEERCAGASSSTRRAVLRVLAVPSAPSASICCRSSPPHFRANHCRAVARDDKRPREPEASRGRSHTSAPAHWRTRALAHPRYRATTPAGSLNPAADAAGTTSIAPYL